jgi:hypothetical protein
VKGAIAKHPSAAMKARTATGIVTIGRIKTIAKNMKIPPMLNHVFFRETS